MLYTLSSKVNGWPFQNKIAQTLLKNIISKDKNDLYNFSYIRKTGDGFIFNLNGSKIAKESNYEQPNNEQVKFTSKIKGKVKVENNAVKNISINFTFKVGKKKFDASIILNFLESKPVINY